MKKIITATLIIATTMAFNSASAKSNNNHNANSNSHSNTVINKNSNTTLNNSHGKATYNSTYNHYNHTTNNHRYANCPANAIHVTHNDHNLWYCDGIYYKRFGISHYEIVRPPLGMTVSKLHNASTIHKNGKKLYISNGVVYNRIKTNRGKMYEVVGYIN